MERSTKPPVERIMARAVRVDGCLRANRAHNGHGYVRVSLGRAGEGQDYVHRIVWRHHHGEIPPGMDVCHQCDVRDCVAIEHLYLGDRKQNMDDARTRGRTSRGELRYSAKLTEANVRDIRHRVAGGTRRRDLAEEFGVCEQTIDNVVNRKKWQHVA